MKKLLCFAPFLMLAAFGVPSLQGANANAGIQIHPNPTVCSGKTHIVGYSIPKDGSEITQAIRKDGVVVCVGTVPNRGTCHVEMAGSGIKKDLHMKDSMGTPKEDTFTFTCGKDTTQCGITQCD